MESTAAPETTRSTRSTNDTAIGASSNPLPAPISSSVLSLSMKSESSAGSNDPWSLPTPEKPIQLRGRNRGLAMTTTNGLLESAGRESAIRSIKRKILSSPDVKSKPENADEPGSSSKLPEKYEMLCKTFHSLHYVVRLMRMKGVTPAFSNVCPKVEQLTDRRFSYEQLAQLKFILPEAIVLKKVSILDESTSCMKYDIHISFDMDSLKTDGNAEGGSGKLQLSKVFRLRLVTFVKSHSEECEVPEGPLPEPFGRPSEVSSLYSFEPTNSPVSAKTATDHLLEEKITASHLPLSFHKRFSQKVGSQEITRSCVSDHPQTSEIAVAKSKTSRRASKEELVDDLVAPSTRDSCMEIPQCDSDAAPIAAPCVSSTSLLATPCKNTTLLDNRHYTQKTPSKLDSIPMTATPASLTPKRSLMSPDDEDSKKSSNKLARRALRLPARSLKFDNPLENANSEEDRVKQASCSSVESKLLDILDEDLMQSIMEKEQKAREENDPAISQAKRRRDMIAGLPKLFDMVHFYFQSKKRSIVTKEEFMHSMLASHSGFLKRKMVEEQLKLLQELAPEYISENIASSGDCLLRVNKVRDVESIRARLDEAK
ncbi:hypothetical protein QQ045_018448 [Rhodiola kirilowii]